MNGSLQNAAFVYMLSAASWLVDTTARADAEAWKQAGNNNHVIELQQRAGDPGESGDVTIDFYGHAAFRITSPNGVSLLFDPWRNDPSGAWGLWFPREFPNVAVDVVLSTHAHFDHDAVYRPESPMVLDRMAGTWQLGDVRITGLADKHVCVAPGWHKWHDAFDEFGVEGCPPNNPGHMDNVIFVIETGGRRIAMWGDNRAIPADHVLAGLHDLDVLILPVDSSQHLLSYRETDRIIATLDPKLVMPAHYLTAGASSVLSTLGTAEEWVNTQTSTTVLEQPSFEINDAALEGRSKHVIYFGEHHRGE